MGNGISGELTREVAFLSAAGSVASIIALLVVLIQQASEERSIPAEFMVWRLIFAGVSLVATGGIAVSAYLYCHDVLMKESGPVLKVMRICIAIMIALMAVGACIDGLFSALYWTDWLSTPWHLLRWVIMGSA